MYSNLLKLLLENVSLEAGERWRVKQFEAHFFGFTSFFDFTLFHQGLTPSILTLSIDPWATASFNITYNPV
jgi:hypothetical protein